MSSRGSWLHFQVGEAHLLLSTLDVREVIPPSVLAPLPGHARGIGGVVVYQGEFLPVLSWSDLPGGATPGGRPGALAVLRPRLGLPIERLHGTLDTLPGRARALRQKDPSHAWLQGLRKAGDQIWQVVDPDRLVALLRSYRVDR